MPKRMDSTVSTRPGQKRTTRPNSRAMRPRSARARQLLANALNRCRYRPSSLMTASSLVVLSADFVTFRVVDRRVGLRARQYHRSAEVKAQEQTYGGPDALVSEATRDSCSGVRWARPPVPRDREPRGRDLPCP